MERLAFLIEASGERVFALANPEEIEMTRRSGAQSRRLSDAGLVAAAASEDSVIFSGGGVTEIFVNLLFDTVLMTRGAQAMAARGPLAEEPAMTDDGAGPAQDVRTISDALWCLSEARQSDRAGDALRLIWGVRWNIRCVVMEAAQRFDAINADGAPTRCWMRLRLRRIAEDEAIVAPARAGGDARAGASPLHPLSGFRLVEEDALEFEADPALAARFDLCAVGLYGDPDLFVALLTACGVDDPWEEGAVRRVLSIPRDAPGLLSPLVPGSAPELGP